MSSKVARPWLEDRLTRLEILNRLLVQWFFVRIARVVEFDVDPEGKQVAWAVIGFVLPMTGWGDLPFRVVGSKKVWRWIFWRLR